MESWHSSSVIPSIDFKEVFIAIPHANFYVHTVREVFINLQTNFRN